MTEIILNLLLIMLILFMVKSVWSSINRRIEDFFHAIEFGSLVLVVVWVV